MVVPIISPPRPLVKPDEITTFVKVYTLAGFAPGVPPHITPETAAIDAQCVRSMRCPHCRKRLKFAPFGRVQPPAYVALAFCATQGCGYAERA